MNLEQRLESAKSKGYIVVKRLDEQEYFFIQTNKYPVIEPGMIIEDAIGAEYVVQQVVNDGLVEVNIKGFAKETIPDFECIRD